jgi:hypothetical protein
VASPRPDRTHPQALTRSARGPRSDSVTVPALLGLSLELEAAASRGLETSNGLRESSVARGTTASRGHGPSRRPSLARDPANVHAGVAPPRTKHTNATRASACLCQQQG